MADNSTMNKIKGHPGFIPFWKANVSTASQAKSKEDGDKEKQGGGQGEG